MKLLGFILASMTLLSLTACGEKKKETHKYSLSENGCATGEHTFESKDAYCAALKNDELNRYCASALRQQRYQQECPGSYFQ